MPEKCNHHWVWCRVFLQGWYRYCTKCGSDSRGTWRPSNAD